MKCVQHVIFPGHPNLVPDMGLPAFPLAIAEGVASLYNKTRIWPGERMKLESAHEWSSGHLRKSFTRR